jgi:hypothetical protein
MSRPAVVARTDGRRSGLACGTKRATLRRATLALP